MWCEKVIRNLDDHDSRDPIKFVDWVDIQWNECGRLLKKRTQSGLEVHILLPAGEQLRHHDVLAEDDTRIVAVQIVPCELIVADPTNAGQLALLALELGNLHLAVQVQESVLLFCENEQAMNVLESLAIRWTRECRRFAPQSLLSAPAVKVSGDMRVIFRSTRNGSVHTSSSTTPRS